MSWLLAYRVGFHRDGMMGRRLVWVLAFLFCSYSLRVIGFPLQAVDDLYQKEERGRDPRAPRVSERALLHDDAFTFLTISGFSFQVLNGVLVYMIERKSNQVFTNFRFKQHIPLIFIS